jgi:ATP-dependent Lon protease
MNRKLLEDWLGGSLGESVQVVAKFDPAEMEHVDAGIEEKEIPILPLRNMMLFPQTLLPVNVSRESAQLLLSDAAKRKWTIAVFGQKKEDEEQPTEKDLYRTGVLGRVVKMLKLPDGSQTAFLQGLTRVRLVEAHEAE